MMLRRRVMGIKGGSIPYQQIEYLQSSGKQYIITDLIPTQNDIRCVVDVDKSANGEDNMLVYLPFGSYMCHINWYNGTAYFRFRGVSKTSAARLGRHVFQIGNTCKVDNTEIVMGGTSSFAENTAKLYLFAKGQGQIPFKGKMYSFKAYYGDTLLMDLIPVRVGQVGYMYDKVSGELFGNSGTDNFTLGPDIN